MNREDATLEWLCKSRPAAPVRAVLFDFDGTLSTLRADWESVMERLMVELLADGREDEETARMVRAYIDESAGIQTIFQMKWLGGQIRFRTGKAREPWDLKDEYNRRLMETVGRRRESLRGGSRARQDFLIAGCEGCLGMLRDEGIALYAASGTDDGDVREEAALLGLAPYFTHIQGAPARRESCSKEAVIRGLLEGGGLSGETLAVVGDGKVEIGIGRACGARTLGLATDERLRRGVSSVKRLRLIKAGADAVDGDFMDTAALRAFFLGKDRKDL